MSGFRPITHEEHVLATSEALELTSAGTAVVLTSSDIKIKYVDIVVNGGLAAVGGVDADATSGAEVGIMLYPGNMPYRATVENLNLVYAAGATGARLSWTYYV